MNRQGPIDGTGMGIPDALIDAFKSGRVVLFVGSGLSSSEVAGYPTAAAFSHMLRSQVVTGTDGDSGLLDKLMGGAIEADKLDLDDIAEYYELFAGSDRLLQMIRATFNNPTISATTLHRDLWELPNIRQIYTTNFDPLIEKGLEMSRVRAEPRVMIHPQAFHDITTSSYHVFKLHGCAVRSEKREDFVITKSDYLDFETRHPLSKLRAQSELMQNVFLFLGYSLNDSDFQSLYREVHRFAGSTAQSCFAVIRDVSLAKVAYWKQLGVHILNASADQVITAIRTHEKLRLHTSWFEWRSKEGAREDIKQAIAQRALTALLSSADLDVSADKHEVTFILDSGTSTLAFARRLKDLLDRGSDLFKKIQSLRVVTNCAAIVDTLRWIHLPEDRRDSVGLPSFALHVVGGRLRTETQALIPPVPAQDNNRKRALAAVNLMRSVLPATPKRGPVIAIAGATGVTAEGFSTNTEQEVAAKQAMIDCADRVVFLLDHSKFRIGGRHVFLSPKDAREMVRRRSKVIVVVTDRDPPDQVATSFGRARIEIRLISATDLWTSEGNVVANQRVQATRDARAPDPPR